MAAILSPTSTAPGGTQVPRAVVEAMADYLYHHNANTHWHYPTSEETDELIAAARSALADFLGASSSEIAFGANMTTLTFHLARALGTAVGSGGSRSSSPSSIITPTSHPGVRSSGSGGSRIALRSASYRIPGSSTGIALEELISTQPALLAIGAASNALGTVTDVAARGRRLPAHAGALTFVDAVHFAPHELVDVRQLGCDFLACSAYKFYGPHIGVLFGREQRASDARRAQARAGTQTPYPSGSRPGPRITRGSLELLRPSSSSLRWAAGETAGARLSRTFAELRAPGASLVQRLWSGLEAIDG